MDLLGTLSMAFEISFLLGQYLNSNTVPWYGKFAKGGFLVIFSQRLQYDFFFLQKQIHMVIFALVSKLTVYK